MLRAFHPRPAPELEDGFEGVDARDDVRPRVLLRAVLGLAKVLDAHLERRALRDVRIFAFVGEGFHGGVELLLGVALAPHLDQSARQDAAPAYLHGELLGRDVDAPERGVVDATVRLAPLDVGAAPGHVGERLQLLAAEVQVPVEEVAQVPPHRVRIEKVRDVACVPWREARAALSDRRRPSSRNFQL